MDYFSVKNYDKFQHYKDRTPPWIKLYNCLLEDYEFSCLQDASKLHLIMIWLLASRMDNKIPLDPEWLKVKLALDKKPDLNILLEKGFILSDSNALAECKQVDSTEREREESRERAEKRENTMLVFNSWRDILNHKKSKLDAKRKKEINEALSLGYSPQDLQQAIIGCSMSEYHMGKNDRGQKYDSINLIFRNADLIDKFIGIAERGGAKVGKQELLSRIGDDVVDEFVSGIHGDSDVIDVEAHHG